MESGRSRSSNGISIITSYQKQLAALSEQAEHEWPYFANKVKDIIQKTDALRVTLANALQANAIKVKGDTKTLTTLTTLCAKTIRHPSDAYIFIFQSLSYFQVLKQSARKGNRALQAFIEDFQDNMSGLKINLDNLFNHKIKIIEQQLILERHLLGRYEEIQLLHKMNKYRFVQIHKFRPMPKPKQKETTDQNQTKQKETTEYHHSSINQSKEYLHLRVTPIVENDKNEEEHYDKKSLQQLVDTIEKDITSQNEDDPLVENHPILRLYQYITLCLKNLIDTNIEKQFEYIALLSQADLKQCIQNLILQALSTYYAFDLTTEEKKNWTELWAFVGETALDDIKGEKDENKKGTKESLNNKYLNNSLPVLPSLQQCRNFFENAPLELDAFNNSYQNIMSELEIASTTLGDGEVLEIVKSESEKYYLRDYYAKERYAKHYQANKGGKEEYPLYHIEDYVAEVKNNLEQLPTLIDKILNDPDYHEDIKGDHDKDILLALRRYNLIELIKHTRIKLMEKIPRFQPRQEILQQALDEEQGLIGLDNEQNSQPSGLQDQSSGGSQPSLVLSHGEKASHFNQPGFFKRHPILTGVLIGVGVVVALAAIATILYFTAPAIVPFLGVGIAAGVVTLGKAGFYSALAAGLAGVLALGGFVGGKVAQCICSREKEFKEENAPLLFDPDDQHNDDSPKPPKKSSKQDSTHIIRSLGTAASPLPSSPAEEVDSDPVPSLGTTAVGIYSHDVYEELLKPNLH